MFLELSGTPLRPPPHARDAVLLEEGVDIKTVSEPFGHENVSTTLELYGHVSPKMRLSGGTRFAAAVDGTWECGSSRRRVFRLDADQVLIERDAAVEVVCVG